VGEELGRLFDQQLNPMAPAMHQQHRPKRTEILCDQ
jgi:hypothetical protein